MVRMASFAALALAGCAQSTPRYVVRLDLDQIAAHTSAKDRQPGFTLPG
jgi:hypothetical protein